MLIIRKAETKDRQSILKILDETDLHYPGETFDGFYVAEVDGKITGAVRLEEHPNFYFLTSLGVANAHQKQGVAYALLSKILSDLNKDVYLYTLIPNFFKKFNFLTTQPPNHLPNKEIYGCNACFPKQCACMVKKCEHP